MKISASLLKKQKKNAKINCTNAAMSAIIFLYVVSVDGQNQLTLWINLLHKLLTYFCLQWR